MPEKMESALRKKAHKLFPGNEKAQNKYIYGALRNKARWKPGEKSTEMTKRLDKKT